MNEEFIKSLSNVREESLGMIKTLRAVRGENHARLVHAVILADQIDGIANTFAKAASEQSEDIAEHLRRAQMNMVALIMKYLIRSTGMTDEQVSAAFADAELVQKNTMNLVEAAATLSDQGKVMGE